MNDMKETNKLLAKIFFELREIKLDQRRWRGELDAEKSKSWADVSSVNRGPGRPAIVSESGGDVPSGKTPEMIEAERAQQPGGSGKPRVDVEPFESEPAPDRTVVRLSPEALAAFHRRGR